MKRCRNPYRSLLAVCALHGIGASAEATPTAEYTDSVTLPEITVIAIKQAPLEHEATASSTIGEGTVERLDILSVRDAADIIPKF